jgi:hypothetical protein
LGGVRSIPAIYCLFELYSETRRYFKGRSLHKASIPAQKWGSTLNASNSVSVFLVPDDADLILVDASWDVAQWAAVAILIFHTGGQISKGRCLLIQTEAVVVLQGIQVAVQGADTTNYKVMLLTDCENLSEVLKMVNIYELSS